INIERSPFLRESYRGHNIAAIAVDARGHIIDFEFNHNEIFNSSIEHAESRLLRRIFSLRQVLDAWNVHGVGEPDQSYGTLLGGVSIYTTLESCAQCSGIMTLAGVKEIVYLQPDPSVYGIGNILRRLSKNDDPRVTYLQAPLPVSGASIGLSGYDEMAEAFLQFEAAQRARTGGAFKLDGDTGEERFTDNITSFLCTEPAHAFFLRGWPELKALEETYVADPDAPTAQYRPALPDETQALSNHEAVERAMAFYRYVRTKGDRGTPHRV
ncbi:MAG: hypothetical protein HKN04_05415, partial [Rhodothermaceae bacterium]|nr:hypothetical protein [Rhodothermaceae bacterium]